MRFAERRAELVDWVRRQLIGPWDPEQPLRHWAPLQRYPVGVLAPIGLEEGLDPAEEAEEDALAAGGADGEASGDTGEQTQARRRYVPPSSVGFSFYIAGSDAALEVQCSAARYEHVAREEATGQFRRWWTRVRLPERDTETVGFHAPAARGSDTQSENVLGERALVEVRWRPHGQGWIVTVSLVNRQRADLPEWVERNELALFEVALHCTIRAGEVGAYPRVDPSLLSDEEHELELQYRHRHIHAVGHGAAADWAVRDDRVTEIWTSFVPAVEVPQVTADMNGEDTSALALERLATKSEGVWSALEAFVDGYASWVADRSAEADGESLDPSQKAAATRIVGRMEEAIARMRAGISLLRSDALAAEAFAIANRAMLDQMAQGDRARGRSRDLAAYRWRPFQLAFLLTVIESAIREGSPHRDTVDLIWFPTGGGKTEAYLGLMAFVIAHRRLSSPVSGGGTTVLMRYTLRLLTSQQFQRATRMICALELLRRARNDLGVEPITIGMWVGEATSPNRYAEAADLIAKAAQGNRAPPRRLVLDRCPWCETPLRAPDSYESGPDRFHLRCNDAGCDFGAAGGALPCNVVDEALYEEPPTLLVGTIDKFARLAWDDRAAAFLGGAGCQPPSLIIQDELHLIAGALGSVAGLYEAALDTVLTSRGLPPKYVASTATIRMADKQVRRLYARDVQVFPPPGLDCDDSYFARTVPLDERPGRLYVGYMTYALPRQAWMAPLAAALLAAPELVFDREQEDRQALLDAWWTQVVYHGSLKGVGMSHTSFVSQVREWLGRLVHEATERRQALGELPTPPLDAEGSDPAALELAERRTAHVAQLTSVASAAENAATFARLEQPRGHPECLDAVLATNMVSVGLDVGRLALMVINGQPLTTGEYIQASSRVGRAEVPGIVFAHYYRSQARSLSHYENFRAYHESFYRFVEPTSITPFTYQARLRALHAALVIALRHGIDRLRANEAAAEMDPADPAVARVVDMLAERCRRSDPDRGEQTAHHLHQLVREWAETQNRCREMRRRLVYQAPPDVLNDERLLYGHTDRVQGLWATLHSMRTVEYTTLLKRL